MCFVISCLCPNDFLNSAFRRRGAPLQVVVEFGNFQYRDHISRTQSVANVDPHLANITRHPGVNADFLKRQKFRGQFQLIGKVLAPGRRYRYKSSCTRAGGRRSGRSASVSHIYNRHAGNKRRT